MALGVHANEKNADASYAGKANPTDVVEMVKDGYVNGVPMGGTVVGAKKSPVINVWPHT